MCVIIQNFVAISQTVPEMAIFRLFENGGRPPSWIAYVYVWTTRDEYLVVFITLHNLVGMDTIVSIIGHMRVLIFNEFGLKSSIHVQIEFFVGFYQLGAVTSRPQKALLVQKHDIRRIDR